MPICYFFLGGPFRIFWRSHPRRGLVWKDRKIVEWCMGQGEDKDGKEIEPTRGAKLVSDDARVTYMANKTEDKAKHICG